MASLPSYLTSATPVPLADRASWSRTVMPIYFTVVIWFVFWQDIIVAGVREYGPPGGMIASGFMPAFFGIALAAAICHFLLYMAPAQLGMRTGLPLTIVASSTYGAHGGRLLPGLLVGLLQFGWVAVIAWFAGNVVGERLHWATGGADPASMIREWPRGIFLMIFTIIATFVGMKGMRCVARTATRLLLIPIAVLLLLFIVSCSGLRGFNPAKLVADIPPDSLAVDGMFGRMGDWQIVGVLCVYVTSYFAMFGLGGADVAANCRGNNDVHAGGVFGIFLPLVLIGELIMMIIAGMYGGGFVRPEHRGIYNPLLLMPDLFQAKFGDPWGMRLADAATIALALSSVAVAGFFVGARHQQLALRDSENPPGDICGRGRRGDRVPGLHRGGRLRPRIDPLSRRGDCPNLRRHDRRLPDVRPTMAGTEGRLQSCRLDFLARGIRRRLVQLRGRSHAPMELGKRRLPETVRLSGLHSRAASHRIRYWFRPLRGPLGRRLSHASIVDARRTVNLTVISVWVARP